MIFGSNSDICKGWEIGMELVEDENWLKRLEKKVEEAEREAEEAKALNLRVKAKMDEFTKFLDETFDRETALEYFGKIRELADQNDVNGTVKRVFEYIDSLIKQYEH